MEAYHFSETATQGISFGQSVGISKVLSGEHGVLSSGAEVLSDEALYHRIDAVINRCENAMNIPSEWYFHVTLCEREESSSCPHVTAKDTRGPKLTHQKHHFSRRFNVNVFQFFANVSRRWVLFQSAKHAFFSARGPIRSTLCTFGFLLFVLNSKLPSDTKLRYVVIDSQNFASKYYRLKSIIESRTHPLFPNVLLAKLSQMCVPSAILLVDDHRRRADLRRAVELVHQREHTLRFEPKLCFKKKKRRGIINHANNDLNTQENKAASTVKNWEQQLREQCIELSSRHDDCEAFRNGSSIS